MFQLLRLPFCFQLTAMDPCCSHHDESVSKILRTLWRTSFTFYQTITFQVHCLTKRFGTHQAETALWPCHRSEHYQRYHLSLATKLMKDCLFHCVWKYYHKFQIRRSNENNKGFFHIPLGNHMMWVLVRIVSQRRLLQEPTTYVCNRKIRTFIS